MAIKNLIPWNWGEKKVPVKRELTYPPFDAMQREMDRVFDNFFSDFNLFSFSSPPWNEFVEWSAFSPEIDVAENDKEIKVIAELPGMDENDIEVSLAHNMLTINGQKKVEQEDEGKHYYRRERTYGSFRRSIPLPAEVEADNIGASFKKGILTVTLPKSARAQGEVKRIKVKDA